MDSQHLAEGQSAEVDREQEQTQIQIHWPQVNARVNLLRTERVSMVWLG